MYTLRVSACVGIPTLGNDSPRWPLQLGSGAGSFASDGRRRNRETPRGLHVAAAATHRGVVRRPLSAGGPFAFLPRRRGGNTRRRRRCRRSAPALYHSPETVPPHSSSPLYMYGPVQAAAVVPIYCSIYNDIVYNAHCLKVYHTNVYYIIYLHARVIKSVIIIISIIIIADRRMI